MLVSDSLLSFREISWNKFRFCRAFKESKCFEVIEDLWDLCFEKNSFSIFRFVIDEDARNLVEAIRWFKDSEECRSGWDKSFWSKAELVDVAGRILESSDSKELSGFDEDRSKVLLSKQFFSVLLLLLKSCNSTEKLSIYQFI